MRRLALVLAGGQGHRFWPRSSAHLPKQFLRLVGEESLLQATVARIQRIIPPNDIYVVTGAVHETLVRQHVAHLPPGNIICEPMSRDTAAAMGYALLMIGEEDPDAVAVVLPADHHVTGIAAWIRAVEDGCLAAAGGRSVLVGVTPTRPDTAFGYLLLGAGCPELTGPGGTTFSRVSRFVEKPDAHLATRLLRENRCLWNSGMFIWKVSTALALIRSHLPDTYAILTDVVRACPNRLTPSGDRPGAWARAAVLFAGIRPASIDYGLMEREPDIVAGQGEFGWDDVGSWEGLGRLLPRDTDGNTTRGEVVLKDSRGCIVDWDGGPAVVVGLHDTVLAGGGGPFLACRRDKLPELKSVLTGQEFQDASTRLQELPADERRQARRT